MSKIKVVLCEPDEQARIVEIGNSLSAMQNAVGGYIEQVRLTENVSLICNDEGKINGLPLNRAVCDDKGNIVDIIAGPFFICANGVDEFKSLSDKQLVKYIEKFRWPESIMKTNTGYLVIPVEVD